MEGITCDKPDCTTNNEFSSIHCPDCIQKMFDKANLSDNRGCPCNYGKPCNERCTCVSAISSFGCDNCCRYGSLEQREDKAEYLKEKVYEADYLKESGIDDFLDYMEEYFPDWVKELREWLPDFLNTKKER